MLPLSSGWWAESPTLVILFKNMHTAVPFKWCKPTYILHSCTLGRTTKNRFLHDLSSLQLFIYLFTPIVEQLTAADFETLKLESGLSIWVPLMSYRQPVHSTLPVPVKLFDLDHLSLCHPWTSVFGPPETQRPAAPITTNETHGKMGKMLGGIYLGEEHKTSLTNQPSRAENVKPFGLNLATESIPHAEANSDVSLPRDVLWIFRVNIFHWICWSWCIQKLHLPSSTPN